MSVARSRQAGYGLLSTAYVAVCYEYIAAAPDLQYTAVYRQYSFAPIAIYLLPNCRSSLAPSLYPFLLLDSYQDLPDSMFQEPIHPQPALVATNPIPRVQDLADSMFREPIHIQPASVPTNPIPRVQDFNPGELQPIVYADLQSVHPYSSLNFLGWIPTPPASPPNELL